VADQNKYYPEAQIISNSKWPYDGAVDACGNSLDGNDAVSRGPNKLGGDKKAQGQGVDDFFWTFFTNDKIDLAPPKIDTVDPAPDASGIGKDKIIDILFSKLMMKSTLKPGCKYQDQDGKDICYISLLDDKVGYWINAYDETGKTHAQIDHTDFLVGTDYSVEVTSEVKDIFQNCYQPCCGPTGGEATPLPSANQCQ
ncbi:MAG: Ig-like domain-containing protein, partial [bacterium]